MEKIKIITDTVSDMPNETAKMLGIDLLPITLSIDGKIYNENEITTSEILKYINTTGSMPKTSQVSPSIIQSKFKEYLSSGYKILVITMSSMLSGTFNTISVIKNSIDTENIKVIDSQSVSCGEYVLVKYAHTLLSQGKSFEEICRKVEEAKTKVSSFIAIDTLSNLEKLGRISKITSGISNLLNIKPIVKLDNGKINVIGKIKGRNKCLNALIESLKKEEFNKDSILCIGYVENTDIISKIANVCENIGVKYDVIGAGAVVAAHTGSDSFAYFLLS